MHLIYFDESKYHEHQSPYFFLGGIIIPESSVSQFESSLTQIQYNYFRTNSLNKDTELHGTHIFDGKGNFKKDRKSLDRRISLFKDLVDCMVSNSIIFRGVRINVPSHRKKYKYPEPEYHLGLMLFLERCCDYLDQKDDLGVVHGDYEHDEVARSVLDFSQFKTQSGSKYRGRSFGRLVDTIYATHSHYSRFLQAADVALYLCQRYECGVQRQTNHDTLLGQEWTKLKTKCNYLLQDWP
ncbi:MAG: DUF3800 domain-containing protein [Deltaproteobacteria bacterium]|nr:DUF3800 domain-containing protein [Deltaproteobacteria bacterium]